MSGYIHLALTDLAIAAALLIVNAGLSIAFRLGLARTLLIAATRMVVQLVLIGYVLKFLFSALSPWLTLVAGLVMVLAAAREVRARQSRPHAGIWGYGIGGATILIAATTVLVMALTVQLQPEPIYDPRYALPLYGMILGNAMTGVSLGLEALSVGARRDKPAIEAQLMLGASRWTAMRPLARQALHNGFMPIINAMSATGIVALPGMMTGQILAGADPTEAVRYQILIMFLIAAATGFGVLLAVMGGVWRLTDERHRLRLDRLVA